jgi:hypothetical protein
MVAYIQYRYQKLQAIQEKLREERRKIYFDLLSPFISMFTKPLDMEKITNELQSFDYHKTIFEFEILGSDDSVRAHGELMRFFFKGEYKNNPQGMLKLLGELLIEIRKDLGNADTNMNIKDILTPLITDIDKLEI